MYGNKYSKMLVGLTFAGVFGVLAVAATPGAAQAQGAQPQAGQSWCLHGSGDLYACGFASREQCEAARDGFSMCDASGVAAQPAYVEAERIYRAATANAKLDANAKLVGPMKRRHAR